MSRRLRGAFTLIEMMVVLLIISILIGLLLAGVTAVRRNVYITMTVMELDQIKQALTQYKSDYSAFPPSAGEWTTSTATSNAATNWPVRVSRLQQHFRKMFPQLTSTFPTETPASGYTIYARTYAAGGAPGTTTLDLRNLDAAEAYLFFLNGPPIITDGATGKIFTFNGWASDPTKPIDTTAAFAERTQRKLPLLELPSGRLADQDGDNWPEYYTYESPKTPVVYFLGNQYTYTNGSATATVAYQMSIEPAGMARPYAARVIDTLTDTAKNTRDGWIDPDGIQLIVAGKDGLYGTVPTTAPSAAPHPSSVNLVNGAARTFPINEFGASMPFRSGELDNITNFHGTTIGSAE